MEPKACPNCHVPRTEGAIPCPCCGYPFTELHAPQWLRMPVFSPDGSLDVEATKSGRRWCCEISTELPMFQEAARRIRAARQQE